MKKLERLKELVFQGDNKACFIEREQILNRLEKEMANYQQSDKYAKVFATLLSEVSTPIHPDDYFAGRVIEGIVDENWNVPNRLIYSEGHMSFDYQKVLQKGLKGILEEMEETARRKADEESFAFVRNAKIVISAIRDYTSRYAKEAEKMGNFKMAEALKSVPFEPAYDFYSALQGIWILHMIASCYVGSRDYAFGRFDQYMLPYYEKALKAGMTKEEIVELLAGFFVKTNEICGTATWNHLEKPILSQASKQYINIGGETPNAFSFVVLEAAKLVNMAQPQIIVLLQPEANPGFTTAVFEALSVLTDKMLIYHFTPISEELKRRDIPEEISKNFTYSACSTLDLDYHTFRKEFFVPTVQIFLQTLYQKTYHSITEILSDWKEELCRQMQDYVDAAQKSYPEDGGRKVFVLDSILLSDTAAQCRYACDATSPYHLLNLFCPGIATLGDSLMVLEELVFSKKRYTYDEFIGILQNDFSGEEALRAEILNLVKFGNDTDADVYTVMAANTFLEAVDLLSMKENFFAAPGFYSLERDNSWRKEIGATPDGRKSGEAFSENQSPTYGADQSGITALLKSLAKLPLSKTVTGGLNLTFAQRVSPNILEALVVSYFEMGGFHV